MDEFDELNGIIERYNKELDSYRGKYLLISEIWNNLQDLRKREAEIDQEYLGSKDEINKAKKIITKSLEQRILELENEGLAKGNNENELTDYQIKEIHKIKTIIERETELSQQRNNDISRDDIERG